MFQVFGHVVPEIWVALEEDFTPIRQMTMETERGGGKTCAKNSILT